MKFTGLFKRTQTITGVITKADLLGLIGEAIELPFGVKARIYVKVPSGGDYSGMELEVGDDPEQLDLQFTVTWDDAPEQG